MAGKRGREENLVSLKDRTMKEKREIGKKGGQASGVARRRKKALKTILKEALPLKLSELEDTAIRDLFYKAVGSKNGDRTIAEAVMINFILSCMSGNAQMMKMLLELVEEEPNLVIKQKELALKKELAKAAEKQGFEASSAMQQLVDSLREDE